MNTQEVRIIGGCWRSRRLRFVAAPGLRPTPDRVRETLFNWLQRDIAGARVLDLFAGSGALGLEAASRGAAQVTLVEKDARQARQLKDNLALLAADQCQLVVRDSSAWLADAVPPAGGYDLILLDPPFHQDWPARILRQLAQRGWLRPGVWVYLETEQAPATLVLPPALHLHRQTRAGLVHALLYRIEEDEASDE